MGVERLLPHHTFPNDCSWYLLDFFLMQRWLLESSPGFFRGVSCKLGGYCLFIYFGMHSSTISLTHSPSFVLQLLKSRKISVSDWTRQVRKDDPHVLFVFSWGRKATVMGNCGSSLNCTMTDAPVEVDPDIAGIGVCLFLIHSSRIPFQQMSTKQLCWMCRFLFRLLLPHVSLLPPLSLGIYQIRYLTMSWQTLIGRVWRKYHYCGTAGDGGERQTIRPCKRLRTTLPKTTPWSILSKTRQQDYSEVNVWNISYLPSAINNLSLGSASWLRDLKASAQYPSTTWTLSPRSHGSRLLLIFQHSPSCEAI